jgi:hypothetical protein
MWKRPDNLARIPADSSSNSAESVNEMLMNVIRQASPEEEEHPVPNPKPDMVQNQQQFLPPMFREYTEAVETCTKNASEFIGCASLLSQAREAYEKLKIAGAEIRRVLDSDEATLRTLMDLAQEKADVLAVRGSVLSLSERKPPEPSTLDISIGASSQKARMSKFP